MEHLDLFPSLAELAIGRTVPLCPASRDATRQTELCTEGLSFAPLLTAEPPKEWKVASFSQFPRYWCWPASAPGVKAGCGHVMGYSMRRENVRYTEWVAFDGSNNTAKANHPVWSEFVGAELYQYNDAVNPATGGLVDSCDFDYDHVNRAEDPAMKAVREELSRMLRAGWREALPPRA